MCMFDFTLIQFHARRFGVEVHDFGRSWRSGLAFLALIKSINPYLVDLTESLSKQPRENIQLAFTIAQHSLDIQPLLEPEGKITLNRKWPPLIHFHAQRHCCV